ncbi:MAG: guanylate kinase, partial [Burkholderiales bacterium]|nr:guanylate kinase [Burkholderiales bacterium]
SQEYFTHMLQNNEFLEYAKVYGNFYGTNKNTIQAFLKAGHDIILEIDWQGAKQIKMTMPSANLIYIMPPNFKELEQRLRGRNTDSEEIIQERLSLVSEDISHSHEFNHIIINDNFKTAVDELYTIICNSRSKSTTSQ